MEDEELLLLFLVVLFEFEGELGAGGLAEGEVGAVGGEEGVREDLGDGGAGGRVFEEDFEEEGGQVLAQVLLVVCQSL